MHKLLIFLFIIFWSCSVFGQDSLNSLVVESDVFNVEFDAKEQFPRNYYHAYPHILEQLELADRLTLNGDNNEALAVLNVLLGELQGTAFEFGQVDVLISIGKINYNWGEFEKALNFFREAKAISERCKYQYGEAKALNYIGKYYHSIGQFNKSFQYFQQGLLLSKQLNFPSITSELHRNIGNYYLTIGNNAKALEALLTALQLVNPETDPVCFASVNNHLGNVYQGINDFDKAMKHHKLALKHRQYLNYKEGIGKSLKNLGEVWEDMGVNDSAKVFYKKALQIFEEVDYKKGIVKCHNNLGRIAQNPEEAFTHLNIAMDLSKAIAYKKGTIKLYHDIANHYAQINDDQQTHIFLKLALKLSEENGVDLQKQSILFDLYNYEIKSANFEAALKYYMAYEEVNKRLNNAANLLLFEELKIEADIKQKEKQNEILRSENKLKSLSIQRKNLLIALFVLMIFTLLVVMFVNVRSLNQKKEANATLHDLNLQLKAVNNEKDKLYSIMVHELRNPLHWFRQLTGMLTKNYENMSSEKLQKSLSALDESANYSYHLMDNLLQWTRRQLGKVRFNPERIKLSVLIEENIQFAKSAIGYKNIDVRSDCPGNVEVWFDRMMINTVLRNLISNALKFTPIDGQIQINGKNLSDSWVEIQVRDSGIGIDPDNFEKIFNSKEKFTTDGLAQEKGSGIGLLLCKDFVEQYGGQIQFDSEMGKGSVFIFTVPSAQRFKT